MTEAAAVPNCTFCHQPLALGHVTIAGAPYHYACAPLPTPRPFNEPAKGGSDGRN